MVRPGPSGCATCRRDRYRSCAGTLPPLRLFRVQAAEHADRPVRMTGSDEASGMSIYARFGVPTVINASGTVTRLSGGHMHPEVLAAMCDAAGACVDMVTLQAGACR